MDIGEKYTDKTVAQIERKLKSIYKEAEQDMGKKLREFNKGHKERDAKYRKMVKDGKMELADYQAWLQGQVFQGDQWKKKREQMAQSLYNANNSAMSVVNGSRFDVFAENANFSEYMIAKGLKADPGFGLYNADAVKRLVAKEPDILPASKVSRPKDMAWNMRKLTRAVTQGIIQGEGIDAIAGRMAEVTGTSQQAMVLHARTAMTGAQNAGRIQGMQAAQALGINVKKQWMATLDNRTRDAHQDLDGQVQDVDKPFSSILGDIMFPGDPSADPANVYNCRCTLLHVLDDKPFSGERRDNVTGEDIEYMTYREWKEAKTGEPLKLRMPKNEFGYSYGGNNQIAGHSVELAKEHGYGFPDGSSNGVHEKRDADVYTLDDGTKFIFPTSYDRSKQDATPEFMIQQWYRVQQEYREQIQKTITVVDYRNPKDSYWEKAYKMKNFRSYATGGSEITFYAWTDHDADYVVRTFHHEGGHYIDMWRPEKVRISTNVDWQDAMRLDKKISGMASPTYYGGMADAEDFAESIATYFEDRDKFKKLFPNRTKIIEEVLYGKG